MWNRLGIRTRITLGFVPLLLLMTFLSFNAVHGVDGVSGLFASYRDGTAQSLAVGELSADLNVVRSSALAYRSEPDHSLVDKLHASADAMRGKTDELAASFAGRADTEAMLREVRADVDAYVAAFDKAVELQNRQDVVVRKVMEFGPWTTVALSGIARSAWRANDVQVMHLAQDAIEPLARSLVAAERFIRLEDPAVYDSAKRDLDLAASRAKDLKAVLGDDLQGSRMGSAERLLANYATRLADAKSVILARQDIQEKQLGTIGARLLQSFTTLQNRIVEHQKELGPVAEEMASATSRSTIVISVLLVAVGLVLSYVVGRLISRSVTDMAVLMQRIASGDAAISVEGAEHRHELGAMARSLRVFQETGRAKLAAEADAERQRVSGEKERRQRDNERELEAQKMAHAFEQLALGLDGLSRGDLTVRVGTVDPRYEEIAGKFNRSVGALEETLASVMVAVGSIRNGLGEISVAAGDLSHRTEQQAAGLEETVAALSEVTRGVNAMADGAGRARGSAAEALANAEKSGQVVAEAVSAMSDIERSSGEIGKIIGVIDEIAFQTNLLALNAGVEAARAGEAGRGFAVVAQEVRGLAQRSAEAAREIKGLIQASGAQVERGVDLVTASGRSLDRIVAQVGEMASVVSEIARSAGEQAVNLREVAVASDQMDKVTQQNAAMVEETTTAAQALESETQELARMTERFRTGAGSRAPARAAPRSAPVAQMRSVGRGGAAARPAAATEASWEEF